MMRTTNERQQERKQEGGRSFSPAVEARAEDGHALAPRLSSMTRGQDSCQVAETLYGGHRQSMMVPLTPTLMVRMVYGAEEREEGGAVLHKGGECGPLERSLSSSSSSSNSLDDVRGDLMDGHLDDIMLRLPPVKIKRHGSVQLEQRNNEFQDIDFDIQGSEEGEEEEPCTPKDQPIITEMPQAPRRPGLLEGLWDMEDDLGPSSPMCCFEFDEEWGYTRSD